LCNHNSNSRKTSRTVNKKSLLSFGEYINQRWSHRHMYRINLILRSTKSSAKR
jgi:hypothetical protein